MVEQPTSNALGPSSIPFVVLGVRRILEGYPDHGGWVTGHGNWNEKWRAKTTQKIRDDTQIVNINLTSFGICKPKLQNPKMKNSLDNFDVCMLNSQIPKTREENQSRQFRVL
jgi:hypothetical protein